MPTKKVAKKVAPAKKTVKKRTRKPPQTFEEKMAAAQAGRKDTVAEMFEAREEKLKKAGEKGLPKIRSERVKGTISHVRTNRVKFG